MALLPRRGVLAVAAVIDVALHAGRRPVSAKVLAGRHGLPPRHLEPVLQALVHTGILRGIRGPRGGYELAREEHLITPDDVRRAAGSADEDLPITQSDLVTTIVMPALAEAERSFSTALRGISIADLRRRAAELG